MFFQPYVESPSLWCSCSLESDVLGTAATYLVKDKEKDNDKEFVKNKIDEPEALSDEEYGIVLRLIGQIRNDKTDK